LKKFAKVGCKINPTKDVDSLRFSFVQITIHGKKFVSLIDTRATHSFLSIKTTTYFGKKAEVERELSAFKAINSTMKVVAGVLKNTQVRVGLWFGRLDLRVTDMDDHAMVLGQDFLIVSQAILVVDRDIIMITAGGKTIIISMARKSCLGYQPRIPLMNLYPKDPYMKHDYVEQRELRCMTQAMKEKRMIDFITRARKKYGGGKAIPHILRSSTGTSFVQRLHHVVVDERGSPSTSYKALVGEGYGDRDPADIVEFCR